MAKSKRTREKRELTFTVTERATGKTEILAHVEWTLNMNGITEAFFLSGSSRCFENALYTIERVYERISA